MQFLNNISNLLDEINEEVFDTYRSAVRERINEKSTSIAEEGKKRFNTAFELDNNNERDSQSLSALDAMTIDDMKSKLLSVVDSNTSKSVTVLLCAAQHQLSNKHNRSFEDLHEWKKTRKFQ